MFTYMEYFQFNDIILLEKNQFLFIRNHDPEEILLNSAIQ